MPKEMESTSSESTVSLLDRLKAPTRSELSGVPGITPDQLKKENTALGCTFVVFNSPNVCISMSSSSVFDEGGYMV